MLLALLMAFSFIACNSEPDLPDDSGITDDTGKDDVNKPGTDNPGTDNPGTDNPGTDEPEPVVPEGKAINSIDELIAAVATEGTYYLAEDITLESQLNITAKITLDGNGKKITRKTPTTDENIGDKAIVLITANDVTLKNLTVSGTETSDGWNEGEFAIKIYDATGVVLEDVSATKANAGIQVNSSEVTLKGTIDVSNNVFGGIAVEKATDSELASNPIVLTIDSKATIECTGEKPAIWTNDGEDAEVKDNTGTLRTSIHVREDGNQTYYYAEGQKTEGELLLEMIGGFGTKRFLNRLTREVSDESLAITPISQSEKEIGFNITCTNYKYWNQSEEASVEGKAQLISTFDMNEAEETITIKTYQFISDQLTIKINGQTIVLKNVNVSGNIGKKGITLKRDESGMEIVGGYTEDCKLQMPDKVGYTVSK